MPNAGDIRWFKSLSAKFGMKIKGLPGGDEQLDDGDDRHRRGDLDQPLEIPGEAAVATQPGEAALDHHRR